MAKLYPALDVARADVGLLLAALDDFSPTAVEERDHAVRIFFPTTGARDAARAAIEDRFPADPVDVSDEDWARRSQENLQPVTVGRITIVPNSEFRTARSEIVIAIPPSMGFGTGHHATTRLCLEALQRIDPAGARVLDVGTGSGVLAIAADRLGARESIGIDVDADAIQAARENLTFNPDARHVRFEIADLTAPGQAPDLATGPFDIVLANLTGALLVRAASVLRGAVASGGAAIVSGFQAHEREAVVRALGPADIVWERQEDGWLGLVFERSADEKIVTAD